MVWTAVLLSQVAHIVMELQDSGSAAVWKYSRNHIQHEHLQNLLQTSLPKANLWQNFHLDATSFPPRCAKFCAVLLHLSKQTFHTYSL